MQAYYNDNSAYCIDWLRNLAARGLIARGDFDGRSIADVQPEDVEGHAQVHLFAGIGGWSYALRLAGWPDDSPVWTGSCPCQPYSQAGKGLGDKDPRNLWPHFRRLIAKCRPSVAFGEQTASKAGRGWLAGVRSDLEALGYAVGAADLCAASTRAPHIRQRLFWVADAGEGRLARERLLVHQGQGREASQVPEAAGAGEARGMAVAEGRGQPGRVGTPRQDGQEARDDSGLGNSSGEGSGRNARAVSQSEAAGSGGRQAARGEPDESSASDAWSRFDLVHCTDGKSRRIESGAFPLAYRLPRSVGQDEPRLRELDVLAKAAETLAGAKRNRTGRLTGYGNAIVPQLAAEFIRAFMDLEKPA